MSEKYCVAYRARDSGAPEDGLCILRETEDEELVVVIRKIDSVADAERLCDEMNRISKSR